MKILKTITTRDGKLRSYVETDIEETLMAVRQDRFYRLAQPMEDQVIAAHILEDLRPVSWCSIEQKWVDA